MLLVDPEARADPNETSLLSSVFCTLSHRKSSSFKLSDPLLSSGLDESATDGAGGSLIDPGGGRRTPHPDPDLPVLGFRDDFFC